jgi:hypothetical protein
MATSWTPEQIVALSPDAASAKAGRELATPRKWVTLGYTGDTAWGECQGSDKSPYQTQIDLAAPAFKCSCPSRKFPCKHGLGLFLLLQAQPAAFSQTEPPAWVAEWLESRAERSAKAEERAAAEKTKAADPAAQTKRAASRQAKVDAGVRELELWLRDLVRGGLATAQSKPYSYWEAPAARMVDAQAPGLARLLREMAGLGAHGPGWQEALLHELGRLYLLLEGYKRQDALPPALQAEVRALIGWTQSQEELTAQPGLRDCWMILGQRVEEEERLRVQRTWLWGRGSRRPALVLNFAHGNAPFDTMLLPGSTIEADIVFFPGAAPLRALVKERYGPPQPLDGAYPTTTIAEALAAYAAMLAQTPWLDTLPLALRDVVVIPGAERWLLRDAENHALPLAPHFDQRWRLLACSGGRSLHVFGEWNSHHFTPFGAGLGSKWIGLGGASGEP